MPIVGASYNNTSNAGPSALNLNNVRSNVNANIGFLSAYPLGQTGKFKDFSQCKKGKGIYFHSGAKLEILTPLSMQLVPNQKPARAEREGLKGVTDSAAPLAESLGASPRLYWHTDGKQRKEKSIENFQCDT